MDMIESADTSGMFDSPQSRRDNLRSFRRADVIMEARNPKELNGETCYIAVEASYTVNGRDTITIEGLMPVETRCSDWLGAAI